MGLVDEAIDPQRRQGGFGRPVDGRVTQRGRRSFHINTGAGNLVQQHQGQRD